MGDEMTREVHRMRDEIRERRREVLELRMLVHALEADNCELKRRLRVQAASMEAAKRAAYESFTAAVSAVGQKFD